MLKKKEGLTLLVILLIAAFLRFYNLMHDSPYFFNPDERNMANAITQFRLPNKLSQFPICLISQFLPNQLYARRYTLYANSCNLNPHFFAYGQFPLYLAYASDQLFKIPIGLISQTQPSTINHQLITNFPSAIFWLRFWSAISSTLTVLLVYLITNVMLNSFQHLIGIPKQVRDDKNTIDNWKLEIGHYAALIAAFTPGLIQSAHFGTTESLLTFFFLASVYLSLRLFTSPLSLSHLGNLGHLGNIFFLSLVIGLALGSKLTGLFFFVPPLISLLFIVRQRRMGLWPRLFENLIIGLLIIIGSISVFILSSPYNLIDFPDFKSTVFGYEADIATGKYEAFYTRQFVDTTPILFQAEKIFPYALGWPVFILGTLGFILINLRLLQYAILSILRKYQIHRLNIKNFKIFNFLYVFLIFDFSFLIYLIPNSFLFAKWTRFMTPILPFFAIFAGYFLSVILGIRQLAETPESDPGQARTSDSGPALPAGRQARMTNKLGYWVIGLLVLIGSITPGMAFMSIYAHEDTRVTASKWIYQNIPNNSYILSETANVVDIPLSLPNYQLPITNYQLISFDFYHVDKNPILFEELLNHLEKADYILIPSRRIFINYMRLSETYPKVAKYYQLLFSGNLGFEKMTEISSYSNFTLYALRFTLPDEQSEETFTVFDHPVIRIYKKVDPLTKEQYRLLFET